MNLYLHTDRAGLLKEGLVLSNKRYPKGNSISLFSPMLDASFSEHIETMYNEGISYHGYNYLVGPVTSGMTYFNWITEIYFEYVRFKEFPERPSRFQSIFGWMNIEDAMSFRTDNSHIFEIASDTNYFMADMRLLKMDFDQSIKENNARKYWDGSPMESRCDYVPLMECIINTPVTVGRMVL